MVKEKDSINIITISLRELLRSWLHASDDLSRFLDIDDRAAGSHARQKALPRCYGSTLTFSYIYGFYSFSHDASSYTYLPTAFIHRRVATLQCPVIRYFDGHIFYARAKLTRL